MVQYKLYYFNFRGRAELIRLVFAAAGEQYEDVRIEFNDWPTYKARSPSGQAPFLEVVDGDKTLTLIQSVAIARHLARRFNLAGKDDQEQAIVDMYADQVSDWFNDIVDVIFHEKDEARKKQSAEKLEKETTPNACRIFEKHLSKSSSGFFADSGLTYADLYAVTVLEFMGDKKEALLANYPHLKKMDEQVRANPRVAEWIEKRPKTDG